MEDVLDIGPGISYSIIAHFQSPKLIGGYE